MVAVREVINALSHGEPCSTGEFPVHCVHKCNDTIRIAFEIDYFDTCSEDVFKGCKTKGRKQDKYGDCGPHKGLH